MVSFFFFVSLSLSFHSLLLFLIVFVFVLSLLSSQFKTTKKSKDNGFGKWKGTSTFPLVFPFNIWQNSLINWFNHGVHQCRKICRNAYNENRRKNYRNMIKIRISSSQSILCDKCITNSCVEYLRKTKTWRKYHSQECDEIIFETFHQFLAQPMPYKECQL